MKIVVLDGYGLNPGDLSWEALEALGDVDIYPRTAPEDVIDRCFDAEIVLTNKVVFNKKILVSLPRLRYIGVLATGYNVVDVDAAANLDIVVTNIPAYSTDSVVQNTFAHILAMANRVEHYTMQNREGRWSASPDFVYWDTPLMELAGKTMGIVGLGAIGMRVAKLARCFGMEVYAYTSKASSDLPEGIQKTTFEGLLAVSDILSLHRPLNRSTREMINSASIADFLIIY